MSIFLLFSEPRIASKEYIVDKDVNPAQSYRLALNSKFDRLGSCRRKPHLSQFQNFVVSLAAENYITVVTVSFIIVVTVVTDVTVVN